MVRGLRISLLVAIVGIAGVSPAQTKDVNGLLRKGATTLQQLPTLFADSVTSSLEKDFSSTTVRPTILLDGEKVVDLPTSMALVATEDISPLSESQNSQIGHWRSKGAAKTAKRAGSKSILTDFAGIENSSEALSPARSMVRSANPVPEPASFVVFGLGALGFLRRRRRQ